MAYLVFVFWALCTVAVADDRAIALAHSLRLVSIGCFALLVTTTVSDPRRARTVWRGIALSAVIPCLAAISQAIAGNGNLEATTGINRVYGTFVHPNPFGHYLVLVLIATYIALLGERAAVWVWTLRAVLVLAAVSLALTFTRGAWLAGLLACVVLVAGTRGRKVIVPIILAGSLLVTLVANVPAVASRFESLALTDPSANTALGREMIWTDRIGQAVDRPVAGYGIGSANVVAERYGSVLAGTHNDYLRVVLETGLIGLVIWLAMFALVLIGIRSIARNRLHVENADTLVPAALAAVVAYLIASLVENLLTTTAYQWYWWALILSCTVPALAQGMQARSEGSTRLRTNSVAV